MKKSERVVRLFRPDNNGVSRWVPISEVIGADISWSKNGNMRRGIAFGMDEYVWETQRKSGNRSEVIALRMAGFNVSTTFSQTISKTVREAFKDVVHCNLSMLPVASEDREIDHRFGHKSHNDYVNLYSLELQTPQHFQLIHRSLNLQKRQMCKVCVETKHRPAHPEKGFVEGNATHSPRFPCRGCYLAEPERYR